MRRIPKLALVVALSAVSWVPPAGAQLPRGVVVDVLEHLFR
jgi:hypothetical protein